MEITLDSIQTLALAIVVLSLGKFLRKKVSILEKFCIPAPVIGGMIFAIGILIGHITNTFSFNMDAMLKPIFMIAFFTTVGFTASFKMLKKGGVQVFMFLALAVILVTMQDVVGVLLAKVFNLNPLIGLSTASVPMTGGHGTSGAFAPDFELMGATGATTIAMASATFGLIMGSMIGGPIGKNLIEKHNLLETANKTNEGENHNKKKENIIKDLLNPQNFSIASSQIIIAMGVGSIVSMFLGKFMTFPPYLGAMFVAAIMRNFADFTNTYEIKEKEIDILGGISLSIFLAMALMGLKLWQLSDLGGPLFVMLISQALLMGLFAYFVTFNVMGRDYEAAVMACGHCGFGMGATPNAMANMEALTGKYVPAPRAFFILPLIGSLFIDFFNAFIINAFVGFFS